MSIATRQTNEILVAIATMTKKLRDSSNLFPPLKAITSNLADVLRTIQTTDENREDCMELGQRIVGILEQLWQRAERGNDVSQNFPLLDRTLKHITSKLLSMTKRGQSQALIVYAEQDHTTIQACRNRLNDAIQDILLSISLYGGETVFREENEHGNRHKVASNLERHENENKDGFGESAKVSHPAKCNVCMSVISGTRWRCIACPEWDICSSCYPTARQLHPHQIIGIARAILLDPLWKKYPTLADRLTTLQRRTQANIVHMAACDVCDAKIVGTRWRCVSCDDWDVCETCSADIVNSHSKHDFLYLDQAMNVTEEWESYKSAVGRAAAVERHL